MPKYKLSPQQLRSFMEIALHKAGVPKKDAFIVADVLLASDIRGIESHGVNRLKPVYIDRIRDGILNPVTKLEIVKESKTTAVIDGHNGMGHVIAKKAMEMAIKKAKKYDLGMVVVRNSTHFGIAGYYALMAAEAGMIGQVTTNARPAIAPTFGVKPMLGTNPLTYALPTDEPFPFFMDFATSTIQRGKIEVKAREKGTLPEGLVTSKNGQSLTDAEEILSALTKKEGALLPLGGAGEDLGGHKGYGYATLVEILSSSLQQGNFLYGLSGIGDKGQKTSIELGHSFLVINIEAFTELDKFKAHVGAILRDLRAATKAPGHKRIFTHGEKEYDFMQDRQKNGIPIPAGIRDELEELRSMYKIQFKFPWD